jgi:hypothetical protein
MARAAKAKTKTTPIKDAVYLTADIELAAQDSGDKPTPTKFQGIAYSGGHIPSRNAVIDLDSTRITDSMPVLASHDHTARSVIGVVQSTEKNGALKVYGELFSDCDEQAVAIATKSKRGIKYQMSMALFEALSESIPEGKSVNVNGRSFKGPINVLRNGITREVSVVTLGADPATSLTLLSANSHHEEGSMDKELEARVEELEAKLEAEKTRADNAEKELKEHRLSVRQGQVKALFKEVGREFKEDDAAAYMEMSEAAFTAVAEDFRKLKSKAPAYLFEEQAKGSTQTTGKSALLRDAEARGWKKSA